MVSKTKDRILVVDDDEVLRSLITKILQKQFYRIDTAVNGADAFEMISKEDYSVVIVDLNMPVMTGQEFIKKTRDTGDNKTAMVVLTGHGDLDEALGLLREYQISDFLSKPLESVGQLLFSVENAIEKQQLKNNLEELVDERTVELRKSFENERKLRQKMIQSEKMASLGYLVAGVSHEINTPLGNSFTLASHLSESTRNFNTRLNREELTKNDLTEFLGKTQNSAEIMIDNLGRAAHLVRDFKQLAVDQSGEHLRHFQPKQTIENVFASLGVHKTDVDVKIEVEESFEMKSYPGSLTRVLTHLVRNSLIHGFEGTDSGNISVSVEQDGDHVNLAYMDSGSGMDEETIKRIFDPFYSAQNNHGGSGLGMSIVYNIVTESLEGTIVCNSEPGEGASFLIRIPRQIDHPEPVV